MGRGTAPEGTTIVLAPDPAAFSAAAGGRVPEWAGGVAVPSLGLIVMPAYPVAGVDRRSAQATLRHEIVHLILHEALPAPIPRWFDEGYAEVASGSWDASAAWTLRVAMLLGRTPPLDSLELRWPREAGRARFAYLLSATMVDHMRRRTGEEGFALLLASWRREGSLDPAVRATWGMTMGQLEEEWRGAVRSRYGWLSLAAGAGALWLLAIVLGFLALWPRRRRNRVRIAAMEAEGRMLAPPREDGWEVEYPLEESPEER
jgi:hypothetical protein